MNSSDHRQNSSPSRTRWWQQAWFRWLREGLLILLVFLAIRAYMQSDLQVDRLPDVTIEHVTSGETVSLSSFKGKTVMVHFWASWCPICQLESGWVENIDRDYRLDEDVVIVKVATLDQPAAVAKAIEEEQMDISNVWLDLNGQLLHAFGANAVPFTVFINAQGAVVTQEVGLISAWGMRVRLWWSRYVAS